MKLTHLNLTVNDVDATIEFLATYFEMRVVSYSPGFAVMNDDNLFLLALMEGKDVQYPKSFHIGFPQESKEQVDEINLRLKNDGYKVAPPVDKHGYSFYVKSPGGFLVEVIKRRNT